METTIAPPIALCSACGCQCSSEVVTVGWEYDRIARGALPVFRHATASQCVRARARSDAFWNAPRIEKAA